MAVGAAAQPIRGAARTAPSDRRRRPPCAGLFSRMVGLSDANAEKWSSLFDHITLAKTGAAAPRKRPTTTYRRAVGKLSQQQKRLDEGEIAELVAGYLAGSSVLQLAEQFGCHHETVRRRLAAEGVQLRGRPLTSGQIDEAERLYLAGYSLTEVGEQIGTDRTAVCKRLRERGVPMRPPWVRYGTRRRATPTTVQPT